MTPEEQWIYDEGKRAAIVGRSRVVNPYLNRAGKPADNAESRLWISGYEAGEKEPSSDQNRT